MAQKEIVFSNRSSNPAVEMQSALTLPQMIEELSAHYPFDPAYLTKTLAVQFMEGSASAKGFYYDGDTAVRLADNASIVHIDWRSQKHPDDKDFKPWTYFKIQGSCFTKQKISEHFGELQKVWGPNVRMPIKSRVWGYARAIEHGVMIFGFSVESHCLVDFGFRGKLVPNELESIGMTEGKLRAAAHLKPKVIAAPKP